MTNLTTVTIGASGVITSTGTVSSLDNLFGTAGTSNANVVSIQGIASGVAQSITGPVKLQDGSGNAISSSGGALNVTIAGGVNSNGRTTPAGSAPVVFASQTYKAIAANSTTSLLSGTGSGATGDYLDGLLAVPAAVSPGAVSILDNTTSITVIAGGSTSLTNLVPFYVPIGAISSSGAWHVTTGSSISVIAFGNFT